MTLAELEKWCDYHWKTTRSTVAKLFLTDHSHQELSLDVAKITHFDDHDKPAGVKVTSVINPVTRSPIDVTGGAERDSVVLEGGSLPPDTEKAAS